MDHLLCDILRFCTIVNFSPYVISDQLSEYVLPFGIQCVLEGVSNDASDLVGRVKV